MTKTRNISDLLDANGDVKSGALDNVPASNDASALTTGTLPSARLGTITDFTSTGIDDNATSTAITIDSSKRVGIGTSSPTAKLEINAGDTFQQMKIRRGTGGTDAGIITFEQGDGTAVGHVGGVGSGGLQLRTGSGTGSERMRINSSGKVGINRTSPHGILDVGANAGGSGITTISASTGINQANEYHELMMVNNGGSYGAGLRRTLTQNTPSYINPRLDFVVQNNNTDAVADRQVKMSILGNGRVGIGTTSPTNALTVGGDINSNKLQLASNAGSHTRLLLIKDTGNQGPNRNFIEFHNVSGSTAGRIEHNGVTTVSYITSSDYRLKENVDYTFHATARLKQLKPARFNFIEEPNKTVDGFLAHEVSDIVPEAISGEKDEVQVWKEGEELPEGVSVGDNKLDENGNTIMQIQGIDQAKLVPLLVKTIQELEARITALETQP